MADIKITLVSDDNDEYVYDVEIEEGGSATEHRVILSAEDYEAITDTEIDPDEFVKKSFEFLLEREPKESILGEFNLTEIGQSFPEYNDEIMDSDA